MDMGPLGPRQVPQLPLDVDVPTFALTRRSGISFCSSSSYLTEPRSERRGGISFDSTDKNALYIRMLGDGKMRVGPEKVDSSKSVMAEADRKMLDKLPLQAPNPRLRSRFLSVSQRRSRRRPGRGHVVSSPSQATSHDTREDSYTSATRLLLSRLGCWDFNIFSLDALAGGRCVFQVGYQLFQDYGFVQGFRLDTVKLMSFLSLVEDNYHDSNPYHNALHAADVAQAMHCFLQEKEVRASTTDFEKMVALVASLTHDLDHPGVNNSFLVVTANHLASLYQNCSVLENHHWRAAVGLLQESGLVEHLPEQHRCEFIRLLRVLILATDITRQQEFLLKFSRYIESGEFEYRRVEEHRHFMLQMALKCADISNPCRTWLTSRRWSRRVCREFFTQGDTERALNLPVTPLCDRHGNTVANIQHGFMQFVVSPLFSAWDLFLGSKLSAQLLVHLRQNQASWQTVMDKETDGQELDTDQEGDFEEEMAVVEDRKKERRLEKSGDEVFEEGIREDVAHHTVHGRCLSQPELDLEGAKRGVEEGGSAEEGGSEEDDVVENDVNLLYRYPTTDSELSEHSVRGLSPASEDSEPAVCQSTSSIRGRRYSVPYIRRDLSFYLGLRPGSPGDAAFLRRQSLPVSALYLRGFNTYTDSGQVASIPQSHCLSMDALIARPKISNLRPGMEVTVLDPVSFTPLGRQTLVLQGGSVSSAQSIEEDVSDTSGQLTSNLPTLDLNIAPHRQQELRGLYPDLNLNIREEPVGLASSWPNVAPRRTTTNGSIPPRTDTSLVTHDPSSQVKHVARSDDVELGIEGENISSQNPSSVTSQEHLPHKNHHFPSIAQLPPQQQQQQ
ncbi:high affinity cAMP-specific 3',5'-cyclic phosphodiesterase 7A [Aplysia californica]|uniref:Phosphodiesterase n=1 Tax=Aplysia californica TaxID=6500 RepID=A0ABM1A530_APLCA|nr:high affinity cAMP-specific 3',5'-cyclic phosphodiesterase 7A [Aplysia californica]